MDSDNAITATSPPGTGQYPVDVTVTTPAADVDHHDQR